MQAALWRLVQSFVLRTVVYTPKCYKFMFGPRRSYLELHLSGVVLHHSNFVRGSHFPPYNASPACNGVFCKTAVAMCVQKHQTDWSTQLAALKTMF